MSAGDIRQLPLALQLRSPTRLDDFIAGDNAPLLELLQQQRGQQPEGLIFIAGEPGSGRSHLLLGQCTAAQQAGLQVAYLPCHERDSLDPAMLQGLEQLDLVAIDDVDLLAGQADWELALFNLFNRARERGCRLLFSAAQIATHCGFALADLQSRLGWGISYRLRPLDDTQREQLLCALAARRGLQMPADVARYLVQRHTRDTRSLQQLIERLDRDSLAEQRRLSIPFVRTRIDS